MSELQPTITPLDCAQVDTPTLALPCDGCELLQRPEGCGVLNAVVELIRRNEQHERENAELLARLLNIRIDVLVDTAYTPEGLRDYLQANENGIQSEMAQMQWGVLRLDGRFVNYINRYGNLVGDDFLRASGAEIAAISDGLARVQERRQEQAPVDTEQRGSDRRQQASDSDIFCRQGGDEFSLIIRGVTPQELQLVAARIQNQLTPNQAIERYSEGRIPFIASVGFSHATQMGPEVLTAMHAGNYYEAFRIVNGQADTGQRAAKAAQYEEIWRTVLANMTADEQAERIAQPDDRIVAEQFLMRVCPDFWQNPIEFLVAGQHRSREGEPG